MFTETGAADHHDLSAIDELEDHFAKRRDDEHAAAMAAEATKNDVARSAAKAALFKRVGVAALLAGGGLGLALFGGSFLLAPRVVTKEVERVVVKEVPGPERVVTKEVPGPERVVVKEVPGPERVIVKEVPGPERVVTKEIPGPERVVIKEAPGRAATAPGPERVVIKEVPGPERVVTVPGPERIVYRDAPSDASPSPRNRDERKFESSPGWHDAVIRGRILRPDKNGFVLMTGDGEKSFYPVSLRPDGSVNPEPTMKDVVDPYIGDLTFCAEQPQAKQKFFICTVLLPDGREVTIEQVPIDAAKPVEPWHDNQIDPPPAPPAENPAPSRSCLTTSKNGLRILIPRCEPTTSSGGPASVVPPALDMVLVDIDLGSETIINAMVDTGCSWPLAIPSGLAETLLKSGRAIYAGTSPSTLADGTTIDADIILIASITVDGRTLTSVEATVAPSDRAPVLLGLGALNRLGPYSIENGRIVFTGQPT